MAPVAVSHSRTVLSCEPDASSAPSGKNATDVTELVWPSSVCLAAPVAASHSRTVLSPEPDASSAPSGENATDVTQAVWPSSVCLAAPVAASHSRTVLSCEPDASSAPSRENATDVTEAVWPSSVCNDALQSSWTLGNLFIHLGILSSNHFLTKLLSGAKMSALQYVCRGACSIAGRQLRANRFIS